MISDGAEALDFPNQLDSKPSATQLHVLLLDMHLPNSDAPPQPMSATSASGTAGAATTPVRGDANAIANGDVDRARCFGYHMGTGGAGPRIFSLVPQRSAVRRDREKGVAGTVMPSFPGLLSPERIWQIHAFTSAHDQLP